MVIQTVSAFLIAFTGTALAKKDTNVSNLKDVAMKMVADAKVIDEDGTEFDLQTAKGTIVEVELNRDGTIDEASGDAALAGDMFAPGENMISLAAATEALKKEGKNPTGDWAFEKSLRHGWVYEFEGSESGKDKEYAVRATDGKIVKDSRDIL